jgi:hypothetical protein
MALKRCENGHYYDPGKHTTCPSCGVQMIDVPTRPKAGLDMPSPVEAVKAVANAAQQAASNVAAAAGAKPQAGADDGVTVAIGVKKQGIDPVVGWLVCTAGPDRGRDYRIRNERNFVGRGDEMDIAIRGDNTISRENHASITFNPRNRQFRLHSGNGRGLVYLNDEQIDDARPISAGDRIDLGQTRLIFVPLVTDAFSWEE